MKLRLNRGILLISIMMITVCTIFAANCFSKENNVDNSFKQKLVSANRMYEEGKFSDAAGQYDELLIMNEKDSYVLERLGNLALYSNRSNEAADYFRKAMSHKSWSERIWPFSADIHYRTALAYYRKNDFAAAAEGFKKAAGPFGAIGEMKAFHRQMLLFKGKTPYRTEGPEETVIPFEKTDPLPLIRVSVNGGAPELFLIDTGGGELILDEGYAQKVKAETVSSLKGGYAGNSKGTTKLGSVQSVKLGDFVMYDVPVWTLDLSAISAEILQSGEISGIVGTRVLMQFISTIDYRNGALVLRRNSDSSYSAYMKTLSTKPRKSIPFWLTDMHVMVTEGKINGQGPVLFFVDTGLAGKGFTATSDLLDRAGIIPDWSKAESGAAGGGEAESTDITAKTLSIGSGENLIEKHDISGCMIKGGVPVLGSTLGFSIEGLVSHKFFRDSSLTFDYRAMRLIIE